MPKVKIRVLVPGPGSTASREYYGPFDSDEIAKDQLQKKGWYRIMNAEGVIFRAKDGRKATIQPFDDVQGPNYLPDA